MLRDDLLEPIPGDNPSGVDLYYAPVFDQIKEARREEDDTLPTGAWDRAAKKSDHGLVIKLASEALATRSKDLRLAASLIESQCKVNGLPVLAPSLAVLRSLQEEFWPTLYPLIDDDGDLQLRVNEIQKVAAQVSQILTKMALTKSGLNVLDYEESRSVGYEADASTSDRREKRAAAIEAEKLTAEAFDKECKDTPKSFLVETKRSLDEATGEAGKLDSYQREAYGEQYPELSPLVNALHRVSAVADALLTERLKTEPDPKAVVDSVVALQDGAQESTHLIDESASTAGGAVDSGAINDAVISSAMPTNLSTAQDAYALTLSCAQFLFEADNRSPVPYLVCAALRLGETRMQGSVPEAGFAVAPGAATRQAMRGLAQKSAWADLLRAALPVLAQPCARAWLDLHRYIWLAARENEAGALASAVTGTLRELLRLRPEVRHWTLEDDTGAANPETHAWIDAEVLNG